MMEEEGGVWVGGWREGGGRDGWSEEWGGDVSPPLFAAVR